MNEWDDFRNFLLLRQDATGCDGKMVDVAEERSEKSAL